MSRELINLLPPERARRFRRDYFLRVATVAFILLTVLVVIHGVFLLPSYLAATSEAKVEEAQLAAVSAVTASTTSDAATELAAIKSDAAYLSRLGSSASASGAIRAALSVAHPGIAIQSVSYQPPAPGNPASAKVAISGLATTRDVLHSYDISFTGLPFVSSVDLPISAFAAETNIAFTLTLTGTLTP